MHSAVQVAKQKRTRRKHKARISPIAYFFSSTFSACVVLHRHVLMLREEVSLAPYNLNSAVDVACKRAADFG